GERRRSFAVVVIVDIEPLAEAEARVERKCSNERAARVAGGLEHRGDGGMRRIEFETSVVAHAMLVRIQTSQYVDMGRKRDDIMRMRVGEDDPLAGSAIQKRRFHAGVAGETDRIRAQPINRYNSDLAGPSGE